VEFIIAKSAGFCYGVNQAVSLVEKLTIKESAKIYTIGDIIHNEQVVSRFKDKGVNVVETVEQIAGKADVVIRAHGVAPEVYDKIRDGKFNLTDATCPYVKKIHDLVREKYSEGFQIIIVGDENHPEVIGINGWCDNTAYIINDIKGIEKIDKTGKKLCVVAQTTLTREKWIEINNNLNKNFENVIKFDTICNATSKRQIEAEEISKKVDMMLVVGGRNSSNTEKLFEICKKNCPETFKIETSGEIPPVDINKIKIVGITAGASTPDWIIEEVIEKMSELNKQENEMSFKDAFESSLVTLHTGQIVTGKVIGFNNAEVFVDLGFKSDGIIPVEEFTDDPDFNPEESLKIGSEVEVFVVRVNDVEGTVMLSKKKVDSIKSYDKLEEAFEKKTPIKAKVVEIVSGGVIANANGVRIFIPASQMGDRYVKDLSEFLKQIINVRIIELNKQKRKIVGSHRVLLIEEKSKLNSEIWDKIEVGKQYNGIVKSFTDFGAFVDIGGVDGLVHISEMSWSKVKHPSDVFKIGDKVTVTVLEFDREKKRISLGYRKNEDNPWKIAAEKYIVGNTVKGKVVRLVPFGAFVELGDGIDGLVHISQISNQRIGKPSDVLEIGQEIEAKITEVNLETKKISLSIRELLPIEPVVNEKAEGKSAEEVSPIEHKEELSNTIGENVTEVKE
jgi:small subunit ribosomal protein S1